MIAYQKNMLKANRLKPVVLDLALENKKMRDGPNRPEIIIPPAPGGAYRVPYAAVFLLSQSCIPPMAATIAAPMMSDSIPG